MNNSVLIQVKTPRVLSRSAGIDMIQLLEVLVFFADEEKIQPELRGVSGILGLGLCAAVMSPSFLCRAFAAALSPQWRGIHSWFPHMASDIFRE